MRLFAVSDIHGATESIEAAAPLLRAADWIVIAGDITRDKTRAEAADVIARFERSSTKILAVHGNWDRPEVKEYLEEKGYSLHGTGRVLDGIGFFGLGGSSPTPMNTATEYTEEEIGACLRSGYETVRGASQIVLISHVPPRDVLDRSVFGLRRGSRALRAFLAANPVSLCLCGHIHEAAGIERFQDTLVANAGSFKKGLYLSIEVGADLEVTRGRIGD